MYFNNYTHSTYYTQYIYNTKIRFISRENQGMSWKNIGSHLSAGKKIFSDQFVFGK